MYLTAKSVQLALEKVTLRLETVEQFGEAISQLAPIMDVVRQTKGEIAGLVPEVAGELDRVTSALIELSAETGEATSRDFEVQVADNDAKKILDASRKIASEKAREKFPQLPFNELDEQTPGTTNEAAGNGRLESSILEQVLFYIESHEGRISVSECASQISRPSRDVIKAIDELKEEGKLALEQEME